MLVEYDLSVSQACVQNAGSNTQPVCNIKPAFVDSIYVQDLEKPAMGGSQLGLIFLRSNAIFIFRAFSTMRSNFGATS